MNKIIFHIDVNSAFLSWEAVYRLAHKGGKQDLRKIASAVGGDAALRHGIILAKSIPAKRYGVKTGEALWEAKRKCPDLVLVPPNYELYERCSAAFMEILRDYSDVVEPYSIDEAFVDMSASCHLFGTPEETAVKIKEQIHKTLGFTVNIGISENKLLAKMASDTVVFYKKRKRQKEEFGGCVVRCGGRGCLGGPMLRHPFPLNYQPYNGYSMEYNLFRAWQVS